MLKRTGNFSTFNVFSLIIMVFLVLAEAGAGELSSFPLQINDVSGLEEPWPMSVGLPFSPGELGDGARIRIMNESSEVPAQVDVTATWRDGSVRWALASFNGRPDQDYYVEYGPTVNRERPAVSIRVVGEADETLKIDTGEAVFVFEAEGLLPEEIHMGDRLVLSGSGGGAYLEDNQGRVARVAGAEAEIETELLREGHSNVVVRRTGWYVTDDGEKTARARVWFYLSAGSPSLRVQHSLVFTEDTNDIWVRDYGLEFRTPGVASSATFALGEPGQAQLFESDIRNDDELYMLQNTYPHFLDRESRAEIVRMREGDAAQLKEVEVAGDWADAVYDGYGLTVVMPWLAQQFPKQLSFGPDGARAAFWSGRSGRELDFRAKTLVDEYWGEWADRLVENADSNVIPWINKYWEKDREPQGAEALAQWPSNAQGAARTHDIWLLPRADADRKDAVRARAVAAARPPLVLADPEHLCATGAIGWPIHPEDERRFPDEEAMISEYWSGLISQFGTGLIAWGHPPYLSTGKLFRHGILADYSLRRSVWGLYARSGERRYYEYGSRFNRHIADWWMHHWSAGEKFRGGFASPGGYWEGHMPFIWGDRSTLTGDSSGHDVHNWLVDYYLTGDQYALHMHKMVGEAKKKHWDADRVREAPTRARGRDGGLERWEAGMPLRVLSSLYVRDWDEEFGEMARDLSRHLIDLENPNGLTDHISGGALYKWERNVETLYNYYKATGDASAREAVLQSLEYHYRFPHQIAAPFYSTNHAALLYTIAYRWTGDRNYVRVVNDLVERSVARSNLPAGAHTNAHPTMGVPAAMGLLVTIQDPIDPFPLIEYDRTEEPAGIMFRKAGDTELEMSIALRIAEDAEADAPVKALVRAYENGKTGRELQEGELYVDVETLFDTSGLRGDPRRRHMRLTLPPQVPSGRYTLDIPDAGSVRVLDTNAVDIEKIEFSKPHKRP